jgi:hypothetical protein
MQISQQMADAFEASPGDLDILTTQLKGAGQLDSTQGLQRTGTMLLTADANGDPLELSAGAQTFVGAFVPPEPETPTPVILRAIWQDTPFDDTAHAVIDALLAYLGG